MSEWRQGGTAGAGERTDSTLEIEAARELVWAEPENGRDRPYDQDHGDTADDALGVAGCTPASG